MAFRMTELTDHVRAGRPSDGSINIEIWQVSRGWEPGSQLGPMEEVFIPHEAVDALFEYLR
jgi:hypothetical protein